MFTGLFLAPWMVMYALSTLVMAHDEWVKSFYPSRRPPLITERELDYSRSIPTNSTREQIAETILQDLGLEGTYSLTGGRNGQPLVIHRQIAITTRHITFDATKNKIVVTKDQFRMADFLERLHRRRGYNQYALENIWGSSVDLAVVTMVFWSASGLWLWWELKTTRRWGALAFGAGVALFAMFVALI